MTPSRPKPKRGSASPAEKLVVRRARPEDRDAILEISKGLWGGNDYLPGVWDRWEADREGALLTVTLEGRPVGCSKITLLSPGEVWLEGLRLHPNLHGRGLSHQIHSATFREARRLNPRSVRYSTWIGNEASRHIAETHGFWLVALTSWMWGKARESGRLRSRRAEREDIEDLYRYVKSSECYAATSGLMGVGWKFPEISKRRLRRLVSDGLALVYPKSGPVRAAALLDIGTIDDDMCLGFVNGSEREIALLAEDAARLAALSGREEISAMLPEGRIAETVLSSGFDASTPMQAVVYELGARGAETIRRTGSGDGTGESFEELIDRVYRVTEPEAADLIAGLLLENAPAGLNRQNVRDYVMRNVLPDTTRQLMASMLAFSNRLQQNDVRLVLRAVVMHLHRKYGLTGDAMTIGKRSVSVRLAGRRIVHVSCARTRLTMTLGPGFGACFPPDLDLDVEKIEPDRKTRDRSTGRYESVKLTLTERSQSSGAIAAIDIIMKNALPGPGTRS
jgi:hypothetical protein